MEVLALVKVLERIFRDPDGRIAYHYVLVDFLCQAVKGTLQPDSDAQEACFVPLKDLASYKVVPITLEVIRRAEWLRKNLGTGMRPSGVQGVYD